MNLDTHVYCSDCIEWDEIYENFFAGKCGASHLFPKRCASCEPFDPEDSKPFSLRINYIVKNKSDVL